MLKVVRSTAILLAAAFLAVAQSDRGTITGTVTDPASAVVPGARLVLRNVDTGALAEAQTTMTGNFILPSLPVGSYDVTVEAPGFKKALQKALSLPVHDVLDLLKDFRAKL